jgi:hypothetical protein
VADLPVCTPPGIAEQLGIDENICDDFTNATNAEVPDGAPTATVVSAIVDTANASASAGANGTPGVVVLRTISNSSAHALSAAAEAATSCTVPSFMDAAAGDAGGGCIAGCCRDGACVCRPGYVGALCEYQITCTVAVTSTPESDHLTFLPPDAHACRTELLSSELTRCTCSRLGPTAALLFRQSSIYFNGLFTLPGDGGGLDSLQAAVLWPLLLTYSIAMALGFRMDGRTLYLAPPCLPAWVVLTPPVTLHAYFGYLVRTRSMVVRPFCVIPDHSSLTHLQLVHLLYSNILTTAVLVAATLGAEQCTSEATMLAFLCALAAKLVVSVGRRAFALSNNHGRRGVALKHHAQQRQRHRDGTPQLAEAAHVTLREEEGGSSATTAAASLSSSSSPSRSAKGVPMVRYLSCEACADADAQPTPQAASPSASPPAALPASPPPSPPLARDGPMLMNNTMAAEEEEGRGVPQEARSGVSTPRRVRWRWRIGQWHLSLKLPGTLGRTKVEDGMKLTGGASAEVDSELRCILAARLPRSTLSFAAFWRRVCRGRL